jgi:hypothetical protein
VIQPQHNHVQSVSNLQNTSICYLQGWRFAPITTYINLQSLIHHLFEYTMHWNGGLGITFLSLYQSIPYEAYKGILLLHKDSFFCTQRYLFIPTSFSLFSPSHLIIPPLHSSLPHSTNATYIYNGLGIVSFHNIL